MKKGKSENAFEGLMSRQDCFEKLPRVKIFS